VKIPEVHSGRHQLHLICTSIVRLLAGCCLLFCRLSCIFYDAHLALTRTEITIQCFVRTPLRPHLALPWKRGSRLEQIQVHEILCAGSNVQVAIRVQCSPTAGLVFLLVAAGSEQPAELAAGISSTPHNLLWFPTIFTNNMRAHVDLSLLNVTKDFGDLHWMHQDMMPLGSCL